MGNLIEVFAMNQCTYCDYKSLRLWLWCDHCDYRTNDQINKIKHQKAKHANILLKCKLCEYNTQDRSNLIRHVRKKDIEMKVQAM